MNAKLIFKTIFILAVLLLLVLLGQHNKGYVTFSLPPILPKDIKLQSAVMYYTFFAIGLLTGTILTASSGGSSSGGGGKKSKSKSDK
jgi:uncharacterized membrane protein YciS (DUF1049 family)